MKTLNWFTIILITMIFASCGGGETKESKEQSKEQKIDYPEKIVLDASKGITGGLSEFFTVENAIIKITTKEVLDEIEPDEMIISIELKRNSSELTFDASSVGHHALSNWGTYPYAIEFAVDLFDEDGTPISSGFDSGCDYDAELALLTLQPNETGWIQYDLNYNWALDIEEVLKIKSIKVKSTLIDVSKIESNDDSDDSEDNNEFSSSGSSNNSRSNSSASRSTASSENWDKVLDSYEAFVDKYIELIEKANDGDADPSVMIDCVNTMEKANALGEKMENADDDLTSAQMARFLKLQTKLAYAAATL